MRSVVYLVLVALTVTLVGCSQPAPAEPLAMHVEMPSGEPLDGLRSLAASIDWSPPPLPRGSARVEYFTGVSHELHGVVIRGRRDRDRAPTAPPPAGTFYHEFHHDPDGLLAVIVQVSKDGRARVSSRMIYDQRGRPVGRITYGSFADLVHRRDGRATVAARFTENGDLLGKPKLLGG